MAKRRRRRSWYLRRGWPALLPYLIGAIVGGLAVGAALWLTHSRAAPHPKRPNPLKARPQDYAWTEQPEPAFPIPPFARFLSGLQIVLDPGHIGQRDQGGTWKRGPTGLREAEVNLRVAHFLRDFLVAAGAHVVLTRDADRSLNLPDDEDLQQRADVANRLPADLLLSIHHNGNGDQRPNYTTVFYHGAPGHSPASLSAGRNLVAGLHDALRLPTQLDCALLSDYALFPNKGLAILRAATVPAVLSEASFHSNPDEETRLRDAVYNRREAYGLFLGLARWAAAGLPRVALVQPADGQLGRKDALIVSLDDGLSSRGGWAAELSKILPDSITVKLDGQTARHTFDPAKRQLRITPPSGLKPGRRTLWVDFENIFGQHVLHPEIPLEIEK